ncbi:hypothetical protein ACTJIX_14740, partial [Acinetobacter sp. 22323]
CSVICGPIGCAVDFVCRLLHLKIISLKKPLQIGLCNKAIINKNIHPISLTFDPWYIFMSFWFITALY